MIEKLLIYPYDIEAVPLVRHSDMLYGYEICGLVSPPGWGFSGNDAGSIDGGRALGITVSSDFEAELKKCDTVFFGESDIKLDFENIIKPRMLKAAEAGKNVVSALNMESEERKEILRLCCSNGVYFKSYSCNERSEKKLFVNEELYEFSTPVVFVLGISERTQKFDIQLALGSSIRKMGYKISQVGSRGYCELLGFHSFPYFMYDNSIPESQKIVLFNRYIKGIELKEKPDLIVIGIPGGIMPFNNKFTNKFGVIAYEISQAVVPDVVIFSTLYEDYEKDNFESIFTVVKYKLGFEIDCFNLSNTKFDWETSDQDNEMSFITIDTEFFGDKKAKFNSMPFSIFNCLDDEDASEMTRFIVGKLQKYAEVQYV